MNNYVRNLLGVMFQSKQTPPVVRVQPQHAPTSPEEWRQYWQEKGFPWRTKPEIDEKRQEELAKCRAIVPDIEKGIYPFKGVKLSRADVEWLLATHENGRGPVDWNDEKSLYERKGLDLRGADLRRANLDDLPLARMRGGLDQDERQITTAEQGEIATVQLQGAFLRRVHLEGAYLFKAHLEDVNLFAAYLKKAYLRQARLERADLFRTDLEGAILKEAHLEGASLKRAHLEGADLASITLSDEKHISCRLIDINWGDANIAVVNWSAVSLLGDEHMAHQRYGTNGKAKGKETRLSQYRVAVRANRQLALALQNQGLNEDAARFSYRAQVLQRKVFRFQILQPCLSFKQRKVLWFQILLPRLSLKQRLRSFGAWLFSWFLFLLAGYGYKPLRSFWVYVLTISAFAILYLWLSPHLAWYEAIVVSMTAFHGRGFSPSTFSPGDPLSIASAFEAFFGLIIEVTFIATLTQRFFGK